MKKKIIELIIAIAVTGVLCCACGMEEDNKAVESKSTIVDEKTETSEIEAEPEITLEDYVVSLPKCHIDGLEFQYEEVTQDEYTYPSIKALNSFDSKICGMIDYIIFDLDEDKEEELLTLWLTEGAEHTKEVTVKVYEKEGTEITEKSSLVCIKELFDRCEIGAIRFFIKDNRYIGIDHWEGVCTIGDGIRYAMNISCYNGESLVNIVNHDMSGSTFYEEGFDDMEWYQQLKETSMVETSKRIYDREAYGICFAEKGIEVLSKIEVRFKKNGENASPKVICKFVDDDRENDFVLKDSNTRMLTKEDLQNLTKEELRIARNEIYARYGWRFEDEQLSNYFMDKCWYSQGENVDDSILSPIELANKQLILEQEQ